MTKTKYQDLPIVEPTDPVWVWDEIYSLDDAIKWFFDMPDVNPCDVQLWPAKRMPKPTLDDLHELYEDYADELGNLDPLVEKACKAAEKAFLDAIGDGEISMYKPDWTARIDWRELPEADEYIAWRESRESGGDG